MGPRFEILTLPFAFLFFILFYFVLFCILFYFFFFNFFFYHLFFLAPDPVSLWSLLSGWRIHVCICAYVPG